MTSTETRYLTVRQAAFIGVGAMVGAGIFALLGAAGTVAGAAVWLSFLIAGVIAALQGYSFAKLGARYPSAGGLLEYVTKGFGTGHVTGVTAWLTYAANAIVTAMVAVSFGSYASAMFTNDDPVWAKVFALLIIVVMTVVNIAGSALVARAQTVIVYLVLGILVVFAVVTLANMDPSLLAFSGYPSLQDIISSVALTFFAFLGFGIITFTAKDLRRPERELPRAMFLALAIATVIYVAIALGVFGTLTVDEVIASGDTALAVAAQPSLGDTGYWMMAITALFATAGATNAGLYPATGLSDRLAETGQFPGLMARRIGGRAPVGLLIQAGACLLLAAFFALDAIASIGSAVALLIFTFITAAHFRVRRETGASTAVLTLAIGSAAVVLLTFTFTTLIHEPASLITLAGVLVLSIALEVGWRRTAAGRAAR
ncbi:amino acid transporter [Actinoplanes lobatus]|uniref:Amino acid transporter n=1 Tax=Actinoplanes lobatus TaxID=113568 RepID=A0A7W7HMN3_9ACTN|nr:APC family permease [Actinoplanes lobatus]MBB4753295.1 amino acid transporter [Actinoplanes lobatus]GGN59516.1 amino acid transporter [Actinoplanes lobatus]GIE37828.1 amino acid transporter [Actinoplanes lobatus]